MTGGDAVKVAQIAMRLRLAEVRRDNARTAMETRRKALDQDARAADSELAALRSQLRSAATACGGVRRGLRRMLDRILSKGVDVPKLRPLWWETIDGEVDA